MENYMKELIDNEDLKTWYDKYVIVHDIKKLNPTDDIVITELHLSYRDSLNLYNSTFSVHDTYRLSLIEFYLNLKTILSKVCYNNMIIISTTDQLTAAFNICSNNKRSKKQYIDGLPVKIKTNETNTLKKLVKLIDKEIKNRVYNDNKPNKYTERYVIFDVLDTSKPYRFNVKKLKYKGKIRYFDSAIEQYNLPDTIIDKYQEKSTVYETNLYNDGFRYAKLENNQHVLMKPNRVGVRFINEKNTLGLLKTKIKDKLINAEPRQIIKTNNSLPRSLELITITDYSGETNDIINKTKQFLPTTLEVPIAVTSLLVKWSNGQITPCQRRCDKTLSTPRKMYLNKKDAWLVNFLTPIEYEDIIYEKSIKKYAQQYDIHFDLTYMTEDQFKHLIDNLLTIANYKLAYKSDDITFGFTFKDKLTLTITIHHTMSHDDYSKGFDIYFNQEMACRKKRYWNHYTYEYDVMSRHYRTGLLKWWRGWFKEYRQKPKKNNKNNTWINNGTNINIYDDTMKQPDLNKNLIYLIYIPKYKKLKAGRTKNLKERKELYRNIENSQGIKGDAILVWYKYAPTIDDPSMSEYLFWALEDWLKKQCKNFKGLVNNENNKTEFYNIDNKDTLETLIKHLDLEYLKLTLKKLSKERPYYSKYYYIKNKPVTKELFDKALNELDDTHTLT